LARETLGGRQVIIYKNHVLGNHFVARGNSRYDYWLGFLPKLLAKKMPGDCQACFLPIILG
jgi:hypothetical protein